MMGLNWTTWILLLVPALATIAVILRWLNRRPSILGTSDISHSIELMLRGAEDGGRMRLSALDRDRYVTLTRVATEGRTAQLEVALAADELSRDRVMELGGELRNLGVSILCGGELIEDPRGKSMVRIVTNLPADARTLGAIADQSLRALGLVEGDRYRFRFEGRLNATRLRQGAVERTQAAAAAAPRQWQATLLRGLSRYLRRP